MASGSNKLSGNHCDVAHICHIRTHAPQQTGIWSTGETGGLPLTRPRQHNLELSKKSGLRIDIYAAAVLLDDDVVAHRQAKPGTLTSSLAHLRENFAAVELKLPASAIKELDDVETAKAE